MAQLRSIFVLSIVVVTALALTPAAGAADYTLEGEAMTVSPASAGRIVTDSSASGGRRLVLQTNSVASSTVSVPASTRVVVVARSQDCRGSAKMTVALDGSTVNSVTLTNKDAQYAVNVKIAAGVQTIAVAYTTDYKTFFCDRNLLLDSVVVVPAATQPTPPPSTTPTTPPPAQRAGFVYRSGATMMLNGSPYRFVGVNSYDFTGCHTGQPLSASDADKFFAQLPPNSMTRVWAFEPWGTDAIMQTVRLAEARNQKLTLVFADGGGHCSEPTYDAAWYAQGFQGNYLNWVGRVTTAFRDSPAVAIWKLMHEPGSGACGLSASAIKSFYDTTAAYIKQRDPYHLVSTGALAPWQTFQQGASGYATAHSGPNIDLVSVHEYDYPYTNGGSLGSPQFDAANQAAQSLGKPVYVGETGVSLTNGCMTAAQRADVLQRKFNLYLNSGSSGVLYWNVEGAPNNAGSVCNSAYGNTDPILGGAVMTMISQYSQA